MQEKFENYYTINIASHEYQISTHRRTEGRSEDVLVEVQFGTRKNPVYFLTFVNLEKPFWKKYIGINILMYEHKSIPKGIIKLTK